MASKDLMLGGGTAVALLGVIVYNQYKFGKLQEQIDELRGECQTMAKYIQLLEARVASDLRHGGHHHAVQSGNGAEQQITPVQQEGGPQRVTAAQPQVSQQPASAGRGHQGHHHAQPARAANPVPAPQRRDRLPPQGRPVVQRPPPPTDDEAEGSEDEDNSPPVSERRPARSNPPPSRQNPGNRQPVRSARAPEDEEEEKKDSERRARAPVKVASRGPPSATRGSAPSVPAKAAEKPAEAPKKKRFVGKGDDDDEQPIVSSRRSGPKSILKNGEVQNGKGEADVDADLLGDIESVAKSSKREDNEGRENNASATKARMDRTRAIAAAMQKRREEKASSAVAVQ